MYETTDLYSPSKRSVIAHMMQEVRAEVPEWTRDRIRESSQRIAQPVESTLTSTLKTPKRMKKEDILSKEFKDTANKCNEGTRQFNDRIAEIDRDIIALSIPGMKSDNYAAITKLKQEKENLQSRITTLQQVRIRCLKEVV